MININTHYTVDKGNRTGPSGMFFSCNVCNPMCTSDFVGTDGNFTGLLGDLYNIHVTQSDQVTALNDTFYL